MDSDETWYLKYPMPDGWDVKFDSVHNRNYYINHVEKYTSWIDPRKEFYSEQKYNKRDGLEIMDSLATADLYSPIMDQNRNNLKHVIASNHKDRRNDEEADLFDTTKIPSKHEGSELKFHDSRDNSNRISLTNKNQAVTIKNEVSLSSKNSNVSKRSELNSSNNPNQTSPGTLSNQMFAQSNKNEASTISNQISSVLKNIDRSKRNEWDFSSSSNQPSPATPSSQKSAHTINTEKTVETEKNQHPVLSSDETNEISTCDDKSTSTIISLKQNTTTAEKPKIPRFKSCAEGPNPSLRKGPNADFAKGPNSELRKGPNPSLLLSH